MVPTVPMSTSRKSLTGNILWLTWEWICTRPSSQSACCRTGRSFLQKEYRTGKSGYEDFLSDLKGLKTPRKEVKVAVETTGNVWHFVQMVEKQVGEPKVVNTMKFKVIVESTSKTDNRDARTIAYYLWKDMLPTVTLPDAKSR